jgi:RimJ/RimL family protein N-acetyltransferase
MAAAWHAGAVVVTETERLIIRPWTRSDSDVDRIFDAYSRWEVVRYLGSVPRPLETRDQADGAVDRWAQRCTPDGRFGVWAVEIRATAVVAGTVLLVPLPEPNRPGPGEVDGDGKVDGPAGGEGEVEVGWHFHPDSWGHGYASEAARGVVDKGFVEGLARIYAVVRPTNEPSLAVCRRLGMTPLGLTDRWYDAELEAFRVDAPGRP